MGEKEHTEETILPNVNVFLLHQLILSDRRNNWIFLVSRTAFDECTPIAPRRQTRER